MKQKKIKKQEEEKLKMKTDPHSHQLYIQNISLKKNPKQ